jgi:transcriptional regulator with XRE-family HTH domain
LKAVRENTPRAHGNKSDNVRRKRRVKVASITQDVVADRAGITPRTLSAFETGQRVPTAESLAAIASALNLSPIQTQHVNRLRTPGSCTSDACTADIDVAGLLARFMAPALAYDATTTVVAYNDHLARALPAIADGVTPANFLMWFFTSDDARHLFVDYDDVARNVVARFRVSQSYYTDPGPFDRLVAKVARRSGLARRLWEEGIAVAPAPPLVTYRLRDREGVIFNLPVVTLELSGSRNPSLRIVVCLNTPD